ncbi:acetyltransferase [Syntrophus gentianae]|uniref:Acetyltransferase n=1 Tax=Syntrophus gentianae TaxID=43775 RepID=A0A1H7WD94_9BACT|nr:acetate--CoA ligase family protein [Syntrophus gentianae]SEM19483.1 acetyltransferase [Syntrophus gentianae]
MERLFYPRSIVIIGLSAKPTNISRMVLENLLRWGYRGRIFGVNPHIDELNVSGVKMYRDVEDLPEIPDLAVCLLPARFVPEVAEKCGKLGISRMAVLSGGFSEFGGAGKQLSGLLLQNARKYHIRFVGPNALAMANTANGLCLPFIPIFPPVKGGMSIITQSGGVGLMLWNLLADENVGMAKFVSIGNKLDLDETDFLEYLDSDPETTIICMYLESMSSGKRLIQAAKKCRKPIVAYKSNTTSAGGRAALSHTASLSSDEDIIDAAFEEAGIIRIQNYGDLVAVAKVFELPPMHGNRIMVMSPAGGFAVIGADLCEKAGFEFADPGEDFYKSLNRFANAGVIKFSNPLDMGDIYDPHMAAHVAYEVMHNENVDGAIYIGQRPKMPEGNNVFRELFLTDLSKETYGSMLSSGKPLGVCLYGLSGYMHRVKKYTSFPIFNNPEEMVRAFAFQKDWHARRRTDQEILPENVYFKKENLQSWLDASGEVVGEEALELLSLTGIPAAVSGIARDEEEAVKLAQAMGYPVVMKVVSPDALHKTDAGGVAVGIGDADAVRRCFARIRRNLEAYKEGARFEGVRIQKMAGEGHDMFIGGKFDPSFGPAVVFGFGGIYVEVFKDVQTCLCPASAPLVRKKIEALQSYAILKGTRGGKPADIEGYADAIVRLSWLLTEYPEIREVDINPLRLFKDGSGLCALDARMAIAKG